LTAAHIQSIRQIVTVNMREVCGFAPMCARAASSTVASDDRLA
jgi:hypothetical protein